MKIITLTNGHETIVDDEDYAWLNQWKWYAKKDGNTFYAVRQERENQQYKTILMHRQILGLGEGKLTDHMNRDGLDNRRSNLRACTRSQNAMNQCRQKGCPSRFKGVTWHKGVGKWQARITASGNCTYLGLYDTEEEAALVYNRAALECFGEFACLNEEVAM